MTVNAILIVVAVAPTAMYAYGPPGLVEKLSRLAFETLSGL